MITCRRSHAVSCAADPVFEVVGSSADLRTEASVSKGGEPAEPRQYSRGGVLAAWAAAALPMGILSWVVAPAIAGPGPSPERFVITLVGAMTVGLVWQAVLDLDLGAAGTAGPVLDFSARPVVAAITSHGDASRRQVMGLGAGLRPWAWRPWTC